MLYHGDVFLEWKNNLLIVYPEGPFNEEGVDQAINELKQSVISKNFENWLRLEVWEEETLGSELVMNHVSSLFQWCIEHGCSNTAIVVRNNTQRWIIEKIFPKQTKIFDNMQEALKYIEKHNNYIEII